MNTAISKKKSDKGTRVWIDVFNPYGMQPRKKADKGARIWIDKNLQNTLRTAVRKL